MTKFGDRDLIKKQHSLSAQIRAEEEAEKEQRKIIKKYKINVSYSVTDQYTELITISAYDENAAGSAAREWVYEQAAANSDAEIDSVEIISEEYDPEETDTKTIDMFNNDNK